MDRVVSSRWCLVQTKAGAEPIAEAHLKRQAFMAFLPLTWRTVRHARQIRSVKAAFFPGYLFVRLNLAEDQWRAINSTTGVIGLVRSREAPALAPVGLVEHMLASCDEQCVMRLGPRLAPGDAVRLIKGPFAEQFGIIDRLEPAERVRVLLEIMSRRVLISVDRDACSAA